MEDFFTTKYINERIQLEYMNFVNRYYSDIFASPNRYVEIAERRISDYL